MASSRVKTLILTGVLAILPGSAMATTCPLSCSGVGVDDINTTTLNPANPTFIDSSTILNSALNNSTFGNDNPDWNFTFAPDPISSTDFINQIYSAWVVTNDPITGFNGKQYSRPVVNQDAGGANFELGYAPIGSDSDPLSVSFLQIFSQSINGGPLEYFVDNGGDMDTPFYVESGGVGGTTTIDGRTANWMLDIPFDCENGLTGTDPANPCAGGTDEDRLSAVVNFQVFAAVDDEVDGVNNVSLYGGESWGYSYTNMDTPEPALAIPAGLILLTMVAFRRLRRKPANRHAERYADV